MLNEWILAFSLIGLTEKFRPGRASKLGNRRFMFVTRLGEMFKGFFTGTKGGIISSGFRFCIDSCKK
jgi:hypothetical protein